MKRSFALIAFALLITVGSAHAQNPGPQGPPMFSSNCANSPQFGRAVLCYDTTIHHWFYWSGTAFIPKASSVVIASPVAMCTTGATVGATCSEPTATLSPAFADSSYAVTCTCVTPTQVPVVEAVTKSTSAIVVKIAALTTASASCAEVDCVATHN